MGGPFNSRRSLEIFGRPAHEWISRIDQAWRAFDSLKLSDEHKRKLRQWEDDQFAAAVLELERFELPAKLPKSTDRDVSNSSDQTINITSSLGIVRTLVASHGKSAAMTPELVVELFDAQRKNIDASMPEMDVSSDVEIPAVALQTACDWFAADSFLELHPAEQAAIVLLRLLELKLQKGATTTVALIAASLYTLRRELPPLIVRPDLFAAFDAAKLEASRMNTRPMVDLLAQSLESTLSSEREMLK